MMLEIKNKVPSTYYNNSRDFQVLGRTLETLLNYINLNISNMRGTYNPENLDPSLVELALTTLAFDSSHNYQNVDLVKLAQIFKKMMRTKGTKEAINDIIYILLRSQRVEESYYVKINNLTLNLRDIDNADLDELYSIDLYLPEKLKDLVLIDDLFDYILPAGYVYTKHGVATLQGDTPTTTMTSSDNIVITEYQNGSPITGQIYHEKDSYVAGTTYKGVVVNSNNNELENNMKDWEGKNLPQQNEGGNGDA